MRIIVGTLALSLLLFSACGSKEEENRTEEVTSEDIIDIANETCPVMELEVMEGEYLDWEGYRIHFCCPGCDEEFLADPEKYMKILCEDPSVTVDLSEFLDCANHNSPECSVDQVEAEACPDCTDGEMCEACRIEDEPMACHEG